MCAGRRETNRFEQAQAARHEASSLVLAARDSRRGSAPTRNAHRRQKTQQEEASHPTSWNLLAVGSTNPPGRPEHDHHKKRGSPLGDDDDGCHLLHRAAAPILKHISRRALANCELSHCARDSWHVGAAPSFSWQLDPAGGEPEKVVGDHTGVAEPGTGVGLGRREEQARLGALALRACRAERRYSPGGGGADAVNVACDPARRC